MFMDLKNRTLRLRKAINTHISAAIGGARSQRGRRLPLLEAEGDRGQSVGVACIVKNERNHIGEWLQFHIMQGVTQFAIYDNGSTDDTVEVIRRYSSDVACTVIPWRTFTLRADHNFSIQALAYGHALCNFGPRLRWMAFLDADEFLFSPSGETLPEVLASCAHLPSVAIPWTNFGPNGHRTRPSGLTIENYTECAPHPLLPSQRSLLRFKSIVDPLEVSAMGSHLFALRKHGLVAFNERGMKTATYNTSDPAFVATDRLRLNHYFTRSYLDIEARIAKGRVSRNGKVREDYLERRLREYTQHTCQDDHILRYVPELKRRMQKIEAPT